MRGSTCTGSFCCERKTENGPCWLGNWVNGPEDAVCIAVRCGRIQAASKKASKVGHDIKQ